MCFSPAPVIGVGGCRVQIASLLRGGVSVEITWGPGSRLAPLIACGTQICSARHLLAPVSHCHVVILPVTKSPIGKEPRTRGICHEKKKKSGFSIIHGKRFCGSIYCSFWGAGNSCNRQGIILLFRRMFLCARSEGTSHYWKLQVQGQA